MFHSVTTVFPMAWTSPLSGNCSGAQSLRRSQFITIMSRIQQKTEAGDPADALVVDEVLGSCKLLGTDTFLAEHKRKALDTGHNWRSDYPVLVIVMNVCDSLLQHVK